MKMFRIALVLGAIVTFGFAAWVPVGIHKTPTPPEVKVLKSDPLETILEINVYGFEIDRIDAQGVLYDVIRLPGEMTSQDVGRPEVPRIPEALCIPRDARVVVTVLESEKVTLKDYNLFPVQKPLTDLDIELPFVIDHVAYASDRLFPSQNVDIWNQGMWRDVDIANTDIYPIQCNPLRKELTVYTHLVVKYSYIGGKGYPKAVEPKFAAMYGNIMCNYDRLNIGVENFFTAGVQYLIITTPTYYNTIQRLGNWHHRQGLKVRYIQKASYTAQEVKDSVLAEYNSNNPRILKWVLLVGDVSVVPTYTGWGCPSSDIWFCDSDLNMYPECGISRLSVTDTTNLRNQINKILKMIQNPATTNNWLTKTVHATHKELYPGKYSACVRGIYNYPYRYYRYTMDTLMGGCPGSTNAALTAAINQGRAVVNYRGHGDVTYWVAWGADNLPWAIANVNALTNGDLTPVVNNNCCLSGDISLACLGEAWMSKYPGGAVASLAASNPSYTYANHCYDSTFFIALGDSLNFSAGGRTWRAPLWDIAWVQNYAGANMVLRHGSLGAENYKMYIFLGDPAMEVWTGPAVPTALTATHAATILRGAQNFAVQVNGPQANALVCASKGTEVHAYAYTNAAGRCTLAINPVTVGTMDVTATKHGFLPYQGTVTVSLAVEEQPTAPVSERIAISTVPFTRSIKVAYAVVGRRNVSIKVFDQTGRLVATKQRMLSGNGTMEWNPDLAAGVYFVKVNAGREYSQKVVLAR